MIMVQVKSPMLFAVGMYLPLATTFAIFVGGIAKWAMDALASAGASTKRSGPAWRTSAYSAPRGMIAGEALVGLVIATFRFFEWPLPQIFANPSFAVGGRCHGNHPVHSDPYPAGERRRVPMSPRRRRR